MSQPPPQIHVDPLSERPFVPLPSPFERYRLTLIDRILDAPSITSILSLASIASNLSSVPEPYTLSDAEYWLSLPPHGNDEIRFKNIDWQNNEDEGREELKERIPFCVVRDSEDGKLVGTVSVRRNGWEWLNTSNVAKAERERLVGKNEALPPGDPEICYSIGFYLSPALHGKGITSAAVKVSLDLAERYMNPHRFEGICRADNLASRRVLEKCGFVLDSSDGKERVEMVWKDGEERKKMLVLQRRSGFAYQDQTVRRASKIFSDIEILEKR